MRPQPLIAVTLIAVTDVEASSRKPRLLWFEVEDLDAVMRCTADMRVDIIMPKHLNPLEDGCTNKKARRSGR